MVMLTALLTLLWQPLMIPLRIADALRGRRSWPNWRTVCVGIVRRCVVLVMWLLLLRTLCLFAVELLLGWANG